MGLLHLILQKNCVCLLLIFKSTGYLSIESLKNMPALPGFEPTALAWEVHAVITRLIALIFTLQAFIQIYTATQALRTSSDGKIIFIPKSK